MPLISSLLNTQKVELLTQNVTQQQQIDTITNQAQTNAIEELQIFVNALNDVTANTYDRPSADITFERLGHSYAKVEIDSLLSQKYSSQEVDTIITNFRADVEAVLDDKSDMMNTYTKDDVDTKLLEKANITDTYSVSDINGLLEDKADIVQVNTLLYDKSDKVTTYTKSATDTLLNTKIDSSLRGVANGVCPLDAGNKVDINYLPSNLMRYKGVWNASTNSPALANGSGSVGDVYITSVGGVWNSITFAVSDWIVYNGSIWQKSDANDDVVSVFGRVGVVVAQESDYSGFYYTKSLSDGKYQLTRK